MGRDAACYGAWMPICLTRTKPVWGITVEKTPHVFMDEPTNIDSAAKNIAEKFAHVLHRRAQHTSTMFRKSPPGTFGRRLTRKLNDAAVNKSLLKVANDAKLLAELREFTAFSTQISSK